MIGRTRLPTMSCSKRPSSASGSRSSSKSTASIPRSSSTTGSRDSSRVSSNSNSSDSSFRVVSLTAAANDRVMEAQIKELFVVYDFLCEGSLSKEVFHYVHKLANPSRDEAMPMPLQQLPSIRTKAAIHASNE